MRHGKRLLALLLMLTLLTSLSVTALADDGGEDAVIVEEEIEAETESETREETRGEPETESGRLTVKCVDTEGKTIRDEETDYLDLSKDLVVDDKYSRPEIENYTYKTMKVGTEEILKLSVSHDGENTVITVTVAQGEVQVEKTLTGSETLLFVYEAKPHEHAWDDGTVTTAPTCTEKGVKTYSCSCGAKQTEEIPALGHDWGDPSYTWSEDNSSCTAVRVCKRDSSHVETENAKPIEVETKAPTCTEKGEKTLNVSFVNTAFAAQSKSLEIPALGHDFAHGRCKRCNEKDPNFKPKLTDSTNGHASWGTDYKLSSDASPKDFQKLLIDGVELSSSDYKISDKDGNTVITIKGSAIKNLKVGGHKVTAVFATGTAERSFNVSDKPKTGDTGVALWTGLLLVSALGSAAAIVTLKKKFSAQ